MEIVRVEGSQVECVVNPGQTQELGRAHGFNSTDKTISRRQVSFFLPSHAHDQETHIQFEVIGINPIYVCKSNEVKIFRRFERGEMENGDVFCVSANDPIWYTLRKVDGESQLAESLESGLGCNTVDHFQLEDIDFSCVDHVKEFGFVVMGCEFDSYPREMIRNIKSCDWFLDESDEGSKRKKATSWKRKKEVDDDDWIGGNEDEDKLMAESTSSHKLKYMTRSKNHNKQILKKNKGKMFSNDDDDDENLEEEEIIDEEELEDVDD